MYMYMYVVLSVWLYIHVHVCHPVSSHPSLFPFSLPSLSSLPPFPLPPSLPSPLPSQTVFLFTDGHVAQEGFLELINNMLTSGMVPALYQDDEKEAVIGQVRPHPLSDHTHYYNDHTHHRWETRQLKLVYHLQRRAAGPTSSRSVPITSTLYCACHQWVRLCALGAGTSLDWSITPQLIGSLPGPDRPCKPWQHSSYQRYSVCVCILCVCIILCVCVFHILCMYNIFTCDQNFHIQCTCSYWHYL